MSNIENPPSSVYTGWFQNGFLIDDETLNQLESQFFKTSSPSSDMFSLNPPILIYMIHIWRCLIKNSVLNPLDDHHVGMGQTPIPLVNIKIAGKWMFIPLKMVCRYWSIAMFPSFSHDIWHQVWALRLPSRLRKLFGLMEVTPQRLQGLNHEKQARFYHKKMDVYIHII